MIEGKPISEQADILRDAHGSKKDVDDKKYGKTDKKDGFASAKGSASLSYTNEKKEKPWSKEEIELLRKAMQKYREGTSRRWEVVSEYIGTGRSVEEILKATKTVLLQKPDSSKSFDAFLEKRKPAPTIASPLSTRELTGESSPGRPANSATSATNNSEESHGKITSDNPSSSGSATASGASSSSDQDAWSAVQEKALVQALKAFPKETSQRWERVAAAVPGKTVNQCKKKFTMLKENFRSKKSAA